MKAISLIIFATFISNVILHGSADHNASTPLQISSPSIPIVDLERIKIRSITQYGEIGVRIDLTRKDGLSKSQLSSLITDQNEYFHCLYLYEASSFWYITKKNVGRITYNSEINFKEETWELENIPNEISVPAVLLHIESKRLKLAGTDSD